MPPWAASKRLTGRPAPARLLGQTVAADRTMTGTSPGQAQGALNDLTVGTVVYVSGLRRADGVIAASRIDRGPDTQRLAWLRGRIDAVQENGFSLSGVRVAQSSLDAPFRPATGEEVTITGAYFGGTFSSRTRDRAPEAALRGTVAAFVHRRLCRPV